MWLIISGLFLSVIGTGISTYRDLKKESDNKIKKTIIISISISIISTGLLAYKEWKADQQEREYKKNQQIQFVLQDVLKYRIAILDNYYFLLTKSMILNNYMLWERGRVNDHYNLIKSWEDVASAGNKEELNKAKSSFEQLQKIAREILLLSATYENLVPPTMIHWAQKTLSLKFEELSTVIDAYHPTKEVLNYAKLTGESIGEVTGKASYISTKILDEK